MKNTILFLLLFTCLPYAYAQTGNPKTKAEIEARQKEAQKALDQLTPEQRKMMEQMGIKIPDAAAGGATDAQIGMAVGSANTGVPKKNETLIAAIPKVTVSLAALPAYIKSVNEYMEKHLPTSTKTLGEKAYNALKQSNYSEAEISNAAVGLWTIGKLEPAVYITGKACLNNKMADADMLSNFSAMLSMAGAPHQAIPLLEFLNQTYPDNTTILNNLGQAWYGLGDIEKADMYLEKTTRIYAYHPQANYTQCLLQESKGNTTKAIEKMKNSMAYSYSLDKLNKLRQLGYKVKGSDMRIPFRPNPNPLGMRNFVRPEYPKNYDEEVQLKYVWDNFQKSITDKNLQLNQQLQPYINNAAKQAEENYKKLAGNQKGNGSVSVSSVTNLSATSAGPTHLYEQTAQRNLEDMNKDGGLAFRMKATKKKVDSLMKSFQAEKDNAHKNFEKKFSVIANNETELAKKGENIGYDACKVQRAYSEWVYKNYNQPLEEARKNYLHQLRIKIEEELYWKQFVQEDDVFAATQINAKKEWLAAISESRYLETAHITENNVCPAPEPDKNKTVKLANFDDMHCAYKSTIDLIVLKNVIECGKTHVEFDAGRLSGSFNFESDNKGNDQFVNGTLEATLIDKSISTNKGPLQIGATVKAGVGIEFTSRGVEDVYVMGEASVNIKSNIIDTFDDHIAEGHSSGTKQPGMSDAGLSDKGVDVGVSGKMSLISGNMSANVFVNTPK